MEAIDDGDRRGWSSSLNGETISAGLATMWPCWGATQCAKNEEKMMKRQMGTIRLINIAFWYCKSLNENYSCKKWLNSLESTFWQHFYFLIYFLKMQFWMSKYITKFNCEKCKNVKSEIKMFSIIKKSVVIIDHWSHTCFERLDRSIEDIQWAGKIGWLGKVGENWGWEREEVGWETFNWGGFASVLTKLWGASDQRAHIGWLEIFWSGHTIPISGLSLIILFEWNVNNL